MSRITRIINQKLLIAALLVYLCHFTTAQCQNISFNHLWVENGLSQSTVFSIYKDHKGFMWFGTRRGLNRYDGYQFKHFMHDVNDSNSLGSNIVHAIMGDKKDNLIIQTDNHLNYYDRYTGQFSIIQTTETFWNFIKDRENNIWTCSPSGIFIFDQQELKFDTVENEYPFTGLYDIAIDEHNKIWLTTNHGVIRYNPENRDYQLFELPAYTQSEKDNFFIEVDRQDRQWICLRNGALLYYSEEKERFVNHRYVKPSDNLLVSSFGLGLDSTILIGTDGHGVIQINTRTYERTRINHIPDKETSLSSNTIYSIFADNKMGILWLGSYMGGVDYYSKYDKGFTFIFHEPYNKNSIINSNIRSLMVDNAHNLWVGTRQGISVIDSAGSVVNTFNQKKLLDAGVTNPIITKIWQDPSGYIWLCSYKGGVVLYDPVKKTFREVSQVYPNITLHDKIGIFDVVMDSKKNIWIATENGTYLFPPNKPGFLFDERFSKKIIEDRAGRIFIASTYEGMFVVDNNLQLSEISFDTLNNSTNSGRINTLYEGSEGNIWIGMGGGGLIQYNPVDRSIQHYTSANGLPDNNIAGIIEDHNHVIWVTTYSGISRYTKEGDRFKNIHLKKGIMGKEFNPNSIEKMPDGTVYAGSINGLLKFDPDAYRENPYLPDIIFTELYVDNEKVEVGQEDSPIEQSIMFTDKIKLKHDQNSIILKFTAPEYFQGDKVKFYYKFGHDEKNWNDLGSNRSLNIVDLKPGEYTLMIKAANSDGYAKSGGTRLNIHVDPPPWKTTTAYIFYAVVILSILLLLRHFTKSKLKLKYQMLLHKAEKEKQSEMNQARVRLFTDVSHEIGTFLTLLNVPLETLKTIETDDIKIHYLEIINKNVEKLVHLVKRIIDLRKIETGNMPLLAEQDNIVEFVKALCTHFETLARKKNIEFIYDFPEKEIITWFDKEKIEYILFNLLSNAFKFEPENGRVTITLQKETGKLNNNKTNLVVIRVNNEGSTIPPDKAQNIFKRFYKANTNTLGSGIGLSLTKSYVEIHKGEIDFNSDSEKGVTFEVKLPFGGSYLHPSEKMTDAPNYEIKMPHVPDEESEIMYFDREDDENTRHKILIVDDDIELQKILKEQLSDRYQVIVAGDVEEGLIKAKSFQPDLLIVDNVMPNGGGLEFCRSVKKDFDLGDIPVIVLTANQDIEEKIKSMEAGADIHITKPFSIYYLSSVIQNLIDLRRMLKNKYNIGAVSEEDAVKFTSMDEKFLEKAYSIIEQNLDNMQFGIPEFIDQMGISKYMLYSKLKALTGLTPNDFILSYKLKKAANILKKKDISDIDLYYKLGFNDVSYFRKCFKKYYGMTPNQYMKSNKFLDQ